MLVDGVEQGLGLQPVARGSGTGLFGHPSLADGFLYRGHDEVDLELGDGPIPELDDLVEVVSGVHMHDREGEAGGPECLHRETEY